ncbi:MAG: hypothetical protein JRI23_18890 [Deltaproteobacteria bacterium]|jgi:ABC-type spermidine/putrescine transport system permease subunit II|nr:hypothetical protein [Deltaproteobacteria bacterium]MBW2533931.1 hypothetical protein [Deltaproteobacteria bacterium]
MTSETPAQAGQGAGQASLSEGQYEFNADENVSIERAGASSSIWAMCAIVGAVLLGTLAGLQVYLDNLRGAILVLPLFLVCAVAGWLYFGAGRALKDVANTEGNDVEHLMQALDRMARAFRYEVIATIVAVLLFVVLAVVTRL